MARKREFEDMITEATKRGYFTSEEKMHMVRVLKNARKLVKNNRQNFFVYTILIQLYRAITNDDMKNARKYYNEVLNKYYEYQSIKKGNIR